MAAEQTSTVLITGAKTGIGKGLLATYAARPHTIAIAAIRDGTRSPAAKELLNLPTGTASKIIVVAYDASSESSAKELVQELQHQHSIKALDIVVANAGILNHHGPLKAVKASEINEHISINTIGPIILYQATIDLLNASQQTPKFAIISSSLGSNTLMDNYPMPLGAYSISKAAVNFVAGKIHREEDKLVVLPLQPGWVQTAMGQKAAGIVGLTADDVPVTIEQSVTGLVKLIDAAKKDSHSGKMWDQNSEPVPW